MNRGDLVGQALKVREFIVERLRAELVGPDPGLPAVQSGVTDRSVRGEEILRQEDPPRVRYGAGVLFPQQVATEDQLRLSAPESPDDATVIEGVPPEVEARTETGYLKALEPDTEQEINRANEFLPSAMGITALVRIPEQLVVTVEAARYEQEELPGQPTRADRYIGWRRVPIRAHVPIRREELEAESVIKKEVETGSARVRMRLHVYTRDPSIAGVASDARLITFALVNDSLGGGRGDEDCLFQCRISVHDPNGSACFLEYPERLQDVDGEHEQSADLLAAQERDSMRLLYRKRRVFAVGHGCAPEWARSETNATTRIWTESVPVYEIPPVVPAELAELELRLDALSNSEELAASVGEQLCQLYSEWIDGLVKQLERGDEIPPDLVPTAQRHVASARACLERIAAGVQLLKERQDVRRAFCLMNRAMLMQQIHYRISSESPREWRRRDNEVVLEAPFTPPVYDGKPNRWRPFQFAFILMNLRSIVIPSEEDREVVDVIWFPTGGGKTEAYLGLAAFVILFRRISDPSSRGTVVLTRYTLRLLTAQQYQRAASLICALEYLRRRNPVELGDHPITIGLWVGSGLTPNTEADAVRLLQRMLREGGRDNPFVLLSCPWCGARMGPYEVGRNNFRVIGYRRLGGPTRVRHVCEDPACEFNEARGGLPVLVTDEAIYTELPALVVATVDKFALLPWRPEASALFGIVDGERRYQPPELIIQDELHLISGPLGSMVGHYESVIDEMCRRPDGIRVKIVASTATIARAEEQVRALYGRDRSFLFPPQGFEWGSSFFAQECPDLPGRMYVGVFATALPSQQTAMKYVASALLQAPLLVPDVEPRALDPYWTLVAYFNSIRELGSAATLVSADIQEYLRVLHRRFGLTPEWSAPESRDRRRWIRTPTLELTSRVPSGQVNSALNRLFDSFNGEAASAVDVCLATNMIQVGLDVPRLGLMVVAGQPKTTSEYIQATSRVGRSVNGPGLVVVLLNPAKPRDRSHYEHFRAYHERIYSWVEPTSVTPFALPVRERALHALVVTMARYWGDSELRRRPDPAPDEALCGRIKSALLDRIRRADCREAESAAAMIDYIVSRWRAAPPAKYGGFGPPDEEIPLMYPDGFQPPPEWEAEFRRPPWPTPSSMRSVDASCELYVVSDYEVGASGGE